MYSTTEIDTVARSGGCRFVYPRYGSEGDLDRPVSGCLGHVVTWQTGPGSVVASFRERDGSWALESDTDRGHKFCEEIILNRLDQG